MLNLMSYSSTNFAAYAPEFEYPMDEINDTNQQEQAQQALSTDKIPFLSSQSIAPPVVTKNFQENLIATTSIVKENIEPLPFPQHRPGPIQRPPKLKYSLIAPLSSFLTDTTQSPSTPDVLVEINHLLDHQNSVTTSSSSVTNPINASAINNDISVLNTPWTPLSPPEWPSKYDSSWATTNIQSSTNSLRQVQNQFLPAQISNDESSVWSSTLETNSPSLESSNTCTQPVPSEWNELFSSTDPSSNLTTQPTNNSWLNFLPVSESPPMDSSTLNRQEIDKNNPLWNLINSGETQQNSTASWWPKISSDGNHNNNNNNNNNNNDNDKSRWDFAR